MHIYETYNIKRIGFERKPMAYKVHLLILIGQCDLISQFNGFALYLGTNLVYEHTSFTI